MQAGNPGASPPGAAQPGSNINAQPVQRAAALDQAQAYNTTSQSPRAMPTMLGGSALANAPMPTNTINTTINTQPSIGIASQIPIIPKQQNATIKPPQSQYTTTSTSSNSSDIIKERQATEKAAGYMADTVIESLGWPVNMHNALQKAIVGEIAREKG